MVRKISPHKGGRTERLSVRITPEDKKLLERLAHERGITMSDIISNAVKSFDTKTVPDEEDGTINLRLAVEMVLNQIDEENYEN